MLSPIHLQLFEHAQGILWSLIFASKNIKQGNSHQADVARKVIDKIRDHSRVLVEEAELVSHEFVSVSMLWIDIWAEAIEGILNLISIKRLKHNK